MPIAKPNGENHKSGTTKPAETVESNICIKAWPEAAVPRILENRSNTASDNIGIASAMPMLNNATGKIL